MNDSVLVVGASHAGLHLAVALRERGHDSPITLVSAENHLPYHRPPLSKAFLDGTQPIDPPSLRGASFFQSANINLVLNERIKDLDLERGSASTESGRQFGYDKLVIATGSRARRLNLGKDQLGPIIHLRDIDDAARLNLAVSNGRRVVVVGGGFIGLEVAAALRAWGAELTIVEATDRLLSRAVSAETAEFFASQQRLHGVDIRLGVSVTDIHGSKGQVTGVRLSDGSHLPADVIVVGIGVTPRTELAEVAGIKVEGGVVVDRSARTSHTEVWAIGDVTVQPHPLQPNSKVRLESVQNATDQASAAASNIVGSATETTSVPWFWSDQFDLKLQMAGAPVSVEQCVTRGNVSQRKFSRLCYQDGQLVGAECINSPGDFIAIRKALATGQNLAPELAVDPTIKLASLFKR